MTGSSFITKHQALLVVGGRSSSRREKVTELYQKIKPGRKLENDPDTQILTSQTTVGIEEVRSLSRLLALKPYNAPPKVAIIPEAERLTLEAQGALLKLLEEPPGETIIILATLNAQNLLPTIVSRCQLVNLPTEPEIQLEKKELEQEKLTLSQILSSSSGERLKIAARITSREETVSFCQKQLFLWRETLLQKPTKKNAKVLREIQKTLRYLAANVNPRLALENLLLSYPQTP